MIISLDKFKNKNTGSGGSGGGDVIINVQGLPFNEIGYDPNQQNDATNILMNDFQISKDAYMNWDSNRTDAAYLFADSEIEYGPAIDLTNVTNINGMYSNCRNLKYVPEIDLTNITEANDLFAECISLNEVRFKGNVQDNINCNNMFANIPATVYLNCSGNSNAIITQAQQYGNQIVEALGLNVSKFKYFLPNTNTILQGILNPESNYAEVNGEKYPLRYFGNGDYKVILPNETTEAVVLYVENQNPHAISTGVDMGILNQELMPATEVLLDNFYNYFEKSEGVGFNNELQMIIPSGGYVIYKVEIPVYFNGRCSLYIDGSAEDGNISGIEIQFYDMYDNTGWMFTLGENTYWDELVNEIYFDHTDNKMYIKFKIQNNTSANVWFTQPIVFGFKGNLSEVNDNFDIKKRFFCIDKLNGYNVFSSGSVDVQLNGDIYNTGDTFYDRTETANYLPQERETGVPGQYTTMYFNSIYIKDFENDFTISIPEFPYLYTNIYDYYGCYPVYSNKQSGASIARTNMENSLYFATEGVTVNNYKVTIPADGKVLFKKGGNNFGYRLDVYDENNNIITDQGQLMTCKWFAYDGGGADYSLTNYTGGSFYAGKYLYMENHFGNTITVEIYENEYGPTKVEGLVHDHFHMEVYILDENGNGIDYDLENHPITWTFGDISGSGMTISGNVQKNGYNNLYVDGFSVDFYWQLWNNGINDITITLDDGSQHRFVGNQQLFINLTETN